MNNLNCNNCYENERGIVLITIMIVMTICVGIISILLSHYYLDESRVIDQELVKIRVQWAKRGQVNYVLSRVRGHFENNDPGNRIGICNDATAEGEPPTPIDTDCANDNERINKLSILLDEIQTNVSKGNKVRNWSYGENYHFNIRSQVEDDEASITGRVKFISDIPTPRRGADFGTADIFDPYISNVLVNEICFSKDDKTCSRDSRQGRGYIFITKHYNK